jgi:hypothetical protein
MRSVYLWLFYLNSALVQTAGHQRAVIFYEDILDDWHRELQILCQFLGRPEKAAQVDVQSAVQKFVDQDLHHHRISRSEWTDQNTLDPSNKALYIAQQVYLRIKQARSLDSDEVPTLLQEALGILAPTLHKEKTQAHQAWLDGIQQAFQEMAEQIPPGTSFILVDEDQWETGPLVAGRRRIPFLEKNGQYWGPPADEQTALSEMERLREAGAHYVVFAWPTFWWLEHYTGLNQYLRFNFRCVLENDRLVVFDLRHGTGP